MGWVRYRKPSGRQALASVTVGFKAKRDRSLIVAFPGSLAASLGIQAGDRITVEVGQGEHAGKIRINSVPDPEGPKVGPVGPASTRLRISMSGLVCGLSVGWNARPAEWQLEGDSLIVTIPTGDAIAPSPRPARKVIEAAPARHESKEDARDSERTAAAPPATSSPIDADTVRIGCATFGPRKKAALRTIVSLSPDLCLRLGLSVGDRVSCGAVGDERRFTLRPAAPDAGGLVVSRLGRGNRLSIFIPASTHGVATPHSQEGVEARLLINQVGVVITAPAWFGEASVRRAPRPPVPGKRGGSAAKARQQRPAPPAIRPAEPPASSAAPADKATLDAFLRTQLPLSTEKDDDDGTGYRCAVCGKAAKLECPDCYALTCRGCWLEHRKTHRSSGGITGAESGRRDIEREGMRA